MCLKTLLRKFNRLLEPKPEARLGWILPGRINSIEHRAYFIDFKYNGVVIHRLEILGLLNATEVWLFLEKLGPKISFPIKEPATPWCLTCYDEKCNTLFTRYTYTKPAQIRLAFFLIKKRFRNVFKIW